MSANSTVRERDHNPKASLAELVLAATRRGLLRWRATHSHYARQAYISDLGNVGLVLQPFFFNRAELAVFGPNLVGSSYQTPYEFSGPHTPATANFFEGLFFVDASDISKELRTLILNELKLRREREITELSAVNKARNAVLESKVRALLEDLLADANQKE